MLVQLPIRNIMFKVANCGTTVGICPLSDTRMVMKHKWLKAKLNVLCCCSDGICEPKAFIAFGLCMENYNCHANTAFGLWGNLVPRNMVESIFIKEQMYLFFLKEYLS